MSGLFIILDGCSVRIVGEPDRKLGIPRRQSFAWEADARAYAQRLAVERGWRLEEAKRGAR